MKCPFKMFQMVKADKIPKGYKKHYPWKEGDLLVFVSEILQMPGHCILIDRKGKLHVGYHTDNFIEPDPEEI
jgi:hypothetical protein